MDSTKKENRIVKTLRAHGVNSMSFIDVGAKDKLEFIPQLSSMTDLIAFEPNPSEFQMLKNNYKNQTFKSLQLENLGLSDQIGEVGFNITKHSSMSSLLDLDLNNYKKHFGSYKEFKAWKNNVEINQNIKISCTTLDDYFKFDNTKIDFLKIDTQGTELSILKGARQLLDNKIILVLKLEVSTVAVYKNQEMFSDVDIYLRGKGYVLVDLISYKENYKPIFFNSKSIDNHYTPCGDAIYILEDQYLTDKEKTKSSVILFWLGYYSLGLFYLKNSQMSKEDIDFLFTFKFKSLRENMKQLVKNWCPPALVFWLKKITCS